MFRPIIVLTALPLVAAAQAGLSANSPTCIPEAYIKSLQALFQPSASLPESAYSQFDETGSYNVPVQVLVTIGPDGRVSGAEAMTGLEFLRQAALENVRHYRYQPVVRNGRPVCALTSANINFQTPGKPLVPQNSAGEFAAVTRFSALEKQFPLTPEQAFLDLQQEFDVPGGYRRTLALPRLAKAAFEADALDKAVAYAKEALGRNGGEAQAMFDCNTLMGRIALRNGNTAEAAQYLLASAKTPGSPALMTFGPGMALAKELLAKGQTDAVLEFFNLCKAFWTDHATQLDSWAETVRKGGVPNFGPNLRY